MTQEAVAKSVPGPDQVNLAPGETTHPNIGNRSGRTTARFLLQHLGM
jgi:hypothetical protein